MGQRLNQYLAPEFVSYRKGEGGRMLAYAEGHEVINLMNTIFGWDGWNSNVVSVATDFAEVNNSGKWSVGVAATVRVSVLVKERDKVREVRHEGMGYGAMENGPSRGKAMEKCRKEAETDGLKRAARLFGNATGGCLYNSEYLGRVKKVKGPAERIDFREEELFFKPINKRKRFMMAQEKALTVTVGGSRKEESEEKDEFGGEESDSVFEEMAWSEEVITA